MNFIIVLPILNKKKDKTYDTSFIIIHTVTKIFHNEPLKMIIDILGLAKGMIKVVVRNYDVLPLIPNV